MTDFLIYGLCVASVPLTWGIAVIALSYLEDHVNRMENGDGYIGGYCLHLPRRHGWIAAGRSAVLACVTCVRETVAARSLAKRTVYQRMIYEQSHPRVSAIRKVVNARQ